MSMKVDKVQLEIIMKSDKARADIIKLEDEARKLQRELKGMKKGTEEYTAASKRLDEVKGKISGLRKEMLSCTAPTKDRVCR